MAHAQKPGPAGAPGAVLLSDALLGLLFLIISGVHDFLGGTLESELWLAAGALLLASLLLYVASEQPRFLAPDKDSLMYLVREGAASLPRRMAYLLPVSALMAVIAPFGLLWLADYPLAAAHFADYRPVAAGLERG